MKIVTNTWRHYDNNLRYHVLVCRYKESQSSHIHVLWSEQGKHSGHYCCNNSFKSLVSLAGGLQSLVVCQEVLVTEIL